MQVKNIYNFIFHPLSQPTLAKRSGSLLTIVALSILSAGVFLIVFGAVSWKDRKVQIHKSNDQSAKQPNVPQNLHTKIPQNLQQALPPSTTQNPRLTAAPPPPAQPQPSSSETAKVKNERLSLGYTLEDFEKWAASGRWDIFAHAHYDWWMFPINRPSAGHGDEYCFSTQEFAQLKSNKEFMINYRRGVELVLKSWGWDMTANAPVANPSSGQCWTGYGVRLGKMADSLYLLGERELFNTVKTFYTQVCLPYSKLEGWIHEIFKRSF